jgi:hypothetical protein
VEYVEVARCESERGELVLRERRPGPDDPRGGPTVLELRANGTFVMDTAEHASEQALPTRRSTPWPIRGACWWAGLGSDSPCDRVLGDRRVEHVDVVEIEPALVEWMRDGTIPHGRRLLADSRVRVVVADITRAIAEAGPATWDVVLLDVDNGPDQLVHDANARIYDEPFLRAVHDRLEPGGALVVWSAAPRHACS